MSETHIHICRGVNQQYIAQVRRRGCRNFEPVGSWGKDKAWVCNRLMRRFVNNHDYKEGRVLMVADYYDPSMVLTVKRP